MIKVGDVIKNHEDYPVAITSVEVGKYGLLIKGVFDDGISYEVFSPYELPPVSKEIYGWYNWLARDWITLPDGNKISAIAVMRSDPCSSLSTYDARWERTIELMKKEPMQKVGSV